MKKILYSISVYFDDNSNTITHLDSPKQYGSGEIINRCIIDEILSGIDEELIKGIPREKVNRLELVEEITSDRYSKFFYDSYYKMLQIFREGIELSYQFDESLIQSYINKYEKYPNIHPFDYYIYDKMYSLSNEQLKIRFINNLIDEFIKIIGLDNIKQYDSLPDGDVKRILCRIYSKIKSLMLGLILIIQEVSMNQNSLYLPLVSCRTLYELFVGVKKLMKQVSTLLLVNVDDEILLSTNKENDDILSQLVRVDYKKEGKAFIESLDKYYDVSNTVKFSKKRLGAIALSLYISKYFNHNHSFTEFQKLVCKYFDKEEISYKPNKVFDEFNKIMNDFPYNDFKADKEQYKRFFP